MTCVDRSTFSVQKARVWIHIGSMKPCSVERLLLCCAIRYQTYTYNINVRLLKNGLTYEQ